MNFTAPNSIDNCTISQANQFINYLASLGASGATLFACPVDATADNQLVPYVDFGKEGVPAFVPVYLMIQFPGNGKYPGCYTVGMCRYDTYVQKVPALDTLK
jgi:hypothetical protein